METPGPAADDSRPNRRTDWTGESVGSQRPLAAERITQNVAPDGGIDGTVAGVGWCQQIARCREADVSRTMQSTRNGSPERQLEEEIDGWWAA